MEDKKEIDLSQFTYSELAKALGVHITTIARWKRKGILEKKFDEFVKFNELYKALEPIRTLKATKKGGKGNEWRRNFKGNSGTKSKCF